MCFKNITPFLLLPYALQYHLKIKYTLIGDLAYSVSKRNSKHHIQNDDDLY